MNENQNNEVLEGVVEEVTKEEREELLTHTYCTDVYPKGKNIIVNILSGAATVLAIEGGKSLYKFIKKKISDAKAKKSENNKEDK